MKLSRRDEGAVNRQTDSDQRSEPRQLTRPGERDPEVDAVAAVQVSRSLPSLARTRDLPAHGREDLTGNGLNSPAAAAAGQPGRDERRPRPGVREVGRRGPLGSQHPDGAPTFLFADGSVNPAGMAVTRADLAEARIGSQEDCELPVRTAYLFFASASANPVQRFTWYGRSGRANSFALDQGAPCPASVAEIVTRLRDGFRDSLTEAAAAGISGSP